MHGDDGVKYLLLPGPGYPYPLRFDTGARRKTLHRSSNIAADDPGGIPGL